MQTHLLIHLFYSNNSINYDFKPKMDDELWNKGYLATEPSFPPLCFPWWWDDGRENRGLWKAFDSSPAPKLECSSEPRQLLRCIRENQEGAHLFCTSRKTSSFAEVSSPVLFLGCGQGTSYHTREVKGGQHQSPAAHTMPPGDSHWKGSCQHIPCVTGTKNV